MKKIYLLSFLLVILNGCAKDDIILPEENDSISIKEVELNNLPFSLTELLTKDRENKVKLSENFGRIRSDIPAKEITNSKGQVTFTIALDKNRTLAPSSLYFDNLLVIENENGNWRKIVVRYEPEENWYYGQRDFQKYSGLVSFFSLDGKMINSVKLIKGIEEKERTQNKEWTTVCQWELVHVSTLTSGEGTTSKTIYVYEYQETCTSTYDGGTSGGGGDGDFTNGPAPDDPDGLPSTGGTTPIIPEEEDFRILNTLNDPCASLIFNELTLLATMYDMPQNVNDISDNSDLSSLEFTQDVLKIFNREILYDYIVREDSTLGSETTAETKPEVRLNSYTLRYEVTTSFSPAYLQQATALSKARTMIHESVHAYLIYQQKSNPSGDIHTALNNYVKMTGNYGSGNIIHHNFMSQFVNAIAYNLRLWDKNHGTGGNLGWQYYHDMAWGGLANYRDRQGNVLFYAEFQEYLDTFDDTSTAIDESLPIQNRILNIIKNERLNNTNAKGSDC